MNIVIIDYGAGNIQSIRFALERLGYSGILSADPKKIQAADKVIFPGVGEASSAMAKLRASGLDTLIPRLNQPVLGICLGMQLMCSSTEEGNTRGLGIFSAAVKHFDHGQKVPHIGWNRITGLKTKLFSGIPEREFVYLVHSYYVPVCPESIAICDYGVAYSSALKTDNFFGVQFHPEKSSTAGERILSNFLNMSNI